MFSGILALLYDVILGVSWGCLFWVLGWSGFLAGSFRIFGLGFVCLTYVGLRVCVLVWDFGFGFRIAWWRLVGCGGWGFILVLWCGLSLCGLWVPFE